MKRTAMPRPTKPLERRTRLSRTDSLRRSAILRTSQMARSARPQRRKTAAGEFSKATRKLLYARFDGRCAACGDPMHPQAWTGQHRRARGAGGSTDPVAASVTNGVAVHEIPCHRRIEANPVQALKDGFRIPQGSHPRDWPIRIWDGSWVHLTTDGGWTAVAADHEES